MKASFFIFTVFVFLGLFSPESSHAQQFGYRNYTVENDIASNNIYQIIQDRKGFIWAGTEAGVSRFDGRRFKNFGSEEGMPDNEVLKLFEDHEDRIWFVTLRGKIGFICDGKVDVQKKLNEAINNGVTAINEDWNGNLLVATKYKGILKIRNGKILAQYNLPDHVSSSGESSIFENYIHVDKKAKTITAFSYENYVMVVDEKGTVKGIPFDHCHSTLHRDFDFPGAAFLFSPTGEKSAEDFGIIAADHTMKTSVLVDPDELGPPTRLSILLDKKDQLWVGSMDGLIFLKKENGKFKTKKRQLPGLWVSSVIEDREGNIWAASLGEGLFLFTSSIINNFSIQNDFGVNLVTCLETDRISSVYAGTNKGFVYKLKNNKMDVVVVRKKEGKRNTGYSRTIGMVYTSQKDLWVATDYDLTTILGKPKQFLNTGAIKCIVDQGDGNLWVANHGGIYSSQDDPNSPPKYFPEIRNLGRVAAMCYDKNNLYFWKGEGFFVYDKKKVTEILPGNKLFTDRFACIKKDASGDIWIASQGSGLLRMHGKSIMSISASEGLADDICNSFYFDGDSVIWAATNKGLSKITFHSADKSKYDIQNITVKQGLLANKITSIQVLNNLMYVGTSKGVSCFNPREIKRNTVAPLIQINAVKISGKDTTIQSDYTLSYKSNNISIDFAGLSFRCLGQLSYKYQMLGIDTGWVKTNFSTVSFPILPPGEYTFKVKCINEDGIESTEPATLHFTITHPYWQSWWFYASAALMGVVLTIMVFNSRFRQLEERNKLKQLALEEEQKALRAQMNPHFIFNALNSVQHFILNRDILKANEYLSKFASLIRRILDNSKHSLISIYDEIETIQLYIEIESKRFENSFDYEISIADNVDKYGSEIPPMIIQPYIENAIWHGLLHRSSKGILKIHLYKSGHNVVCTIEDNGIGRKKSQDLANQRQQKTHQSVGMEITKDRLSNISKLQNKQYSVQVVDLMDSATGQALGTRVEISFQVDEHYD